MHDRAPFPPIYDETKPEPQHSTVKFLDEFEVTVWNYFVVEYTTRLHNASNFEIVRLADYAVMAFRYRMPMPPVLRDGMRDGQAMREAQDRREAEQSTGS